MKGLALVGWLLLFRNTLYNMKNIFIYIKFCALKISIEYNGRRKTFSMVCKNYRSNRFSLSIYSSRSLRHFFCWCAPFCILNDILVQYVFLQNTKFYRVILISIANIKSEIQVHSTSKKSRCALWTRIQIFARFLRAFENFDREYFNY